jgi:RHS repeat-associated protein
MTEPAVCASEVCSSSSRSTGKERDTESGNDYFDARYYSSTMGRFLSPDWSAKEEPVPYANLEDPQSFDLYSYVRNNPLARTDPDGHCCENMVDFTTSGSPIIDAYKDVVFAGSAKEAIQNFFQNHSISAQIALQGLAGMFGEELDMPASRVTGGDTELSAPTMRAAQRMGMREQGIPTSQQPVAQESTAAGRQYTYEVPKEGGGTETKIVQRNNGVDRSHPGELHVEVGSPKAAGQTDSIGRPRLDSNKTRVQVPNKPSDADLIRRKTQWN